MAWDLRWPPAAPTDLTPRTDLAPGNRPRRGRWRFPGAYTASPRERVGRQWPTLAGPVTFEVVPLESGDPDARRSGGGRGLPNEVRELRRAVLGASKLSGEVKTRSSHLRQALLDTPEADPALMVELEGLKAGSIRSLGAQGRPHPAEPQRLHATLDRRRVERIASDQWYTTQAPTTTHQQAYEWASEAFAAELAKLEPLVTDLEALEAKAEAARAPWTPGRVPIQ